MPKKRVKEVMGFHIGLGHGRLRDNGPEIMVGVTYKAKGRLKMCENGMHASLSIADAANFRLLKPGRTVSLVKITGDVRIGDRKVMGRNRKVLAKLAVGEVKTKSITLWDYTNPEDPILNGVEVLDPKWLSGMENRLFVEYARNKAKVDSDPREWISNL